MRERPVKPTYVIETPVLDPSVYLVRKQNKAFLEGKKKAPQLGHSVLFILPGALIIAVGGVGVCFLWMIVGLGIYEYWPIECFLSSVIAMLITFIKISFSNYKVETTKGVVVPGTVMRANISQLFGEPSNPEQISIRYCFKSPDGLEKVAHTRFINTYASSKLVPAPETSVRVWYIENGKYYLL